MKDGRTCPACRRQLGAIDVSLQQLSECYECILEAAVLSLLEYQTCWGVAVAKAGAVLRFCQQHMVLPLVAKLTVIFSKYKIKLWFSAI